MKILVTGANGYLGRGIVKALLDNGNTVIATDLNIDQVDQRATSIKANIFCEQNPFELFGKPDILLHLAWRDGFVHYSLNHLHDLPNHHEFIQKMVEAGIKKVCIMGSMHEIGFFEGSIDENTPCNPTSYYGIAKNALRNSTKWLCAQADIDWMWLRAFYIVGTDDCGSSIFSKIVRAARNGEKQFPFTMGQNQFDFLDYDTFCQYVALTVAQNCESNIINICSGRPQKLADRVERFIRDNDLDIHLQYGAFKDRPYDSKAVWGNSIKIETIISRYDIIHEKK